MSLRPQGSGVQTYAQELARGLVRHIADVGPGDEPIDDPIDWSASVVPDAVALIPSEFRADVVRLLVDHGAVRKFVSAFREGPPADVVHGLDTDQPLRGAARTVATVHDLGLFDVPWAFGRANRYGKRSLVQRSIRSADTVIAVSDFTAERIEARFRRSAVVVPEAPRPQFGVPSDAEVAAVRQRYALPDRFVFYVGNLEPRKDVATLAAACRSADVPLVVAGGAIASVERPAGAIAIGYVPDSDLAALYRTATVVGYVARYEGFGLPPVEAMACGGCVMATRVGVLPQLDPDCIEFVPVGDVETQAAAIVRLWADEALNSHRRTRGIEAVRTLTWDATAAAHVQVYRDLR